MAAARRAPQARAGAGPAPRGPRRRFTSSSRGLVSGSSRPFPRRHPAAADGRISALVIAMHTGSSAPRPGLATARPEGSPAPRSPRLRPGLRPDVSAWSRRGSYIYRPLRRTPRPSPEPRGLTMNGPEGRRARASASPHLGWDVS